jgi:hypothetical protein
MPNNMHPYLNVYVLEAFTGTSLVLGSTASELLLLLLLALLAVPDAACEGHVLPAR